MTAPSKNGTFQMEKSLDIALARQQQPQDNTDNKPSFHHDPAAIRIVPIYDIAFEDYTSDDPFHGQRRRNETDYYASIARYDDGMFDNVDKKAEEKDNVDAAVDDDDVDTAVDDAHGDDSSLPSHVMIDSTLEDFGKDKKFRVSSIKFETCQHWGRTYSDQEEEILDKFLVSSPPVVFKTRCSIPSFSLSSSSSNVNVFEAADEEQTTTTKTTTTKATTTKATTNAALKGGERTSTKTKRKRRNSFSILERDVDIMRTMLVADFEEFHRSETRL